MICPHLPHLWEEFPKRIQDFLKEMVTIGQGTLYLVGGVTRDYLLYQKLAKDIDIEFHGDWAKIESRFLFEELSFGVKRLVIEDFILEIAPPRIDHYDQSQSPWGHSDFESEFFVTLPLSKSFLRRDFTCNAIAYKIQENAQSCWEDPLHGINHLRQKKLVPCSSDFSKDPVRMMRLIRFERQHGLVFEGDLKGCSLEKLSLFYFLEENLKIDFVRQYKRLYELVHIYQIPVPSFFKLFEFVLDIFEPPIIQTKEEIVVLALLMNVSHWEMLGQILSLKKKTLNHWKRDYELLKQGRSQNIFKPYSRLVDFFNSRTNL